MKVGLFKFLKTHPRLAVNIAGIVLAGTIIFGLDSGQAHAITLSTIPTDIVSSMAGYDNNNCVPNGGSGVVYEQSLVWAYDGSTSNDSYTTPIDVSPGGSVTFDMDGITFLCHIAINPENTFMDNVNQPEDGDPYTTNGGSTGELVRNNAIYLTQQIKRVFDTVTSSDLSSTLSGSPGTITASNMGNPQIINWTSGTRYWQVTSDNQDNFTYKAPSSGLTPGQLYTAHIQIPTVPMNYFSGDTTYQCQISSYQIITSAQYDDNNFSELSGNNNPCNQAPTSVVINFKVNSPTCTPTPTCPCGSTTCGGCTAGCSCNGTCTVGVCSVSTCIPCPNQPTESTSPSITLPQGTYPAQTTSYNGPPATEESPQPTWYQEQPIGEFAITSAGDQYGTGLTNWSPTGYSANPFTLNYAPYITNHPYDPHNTTVNYNEEFTQTVYTTYFSHWDCPAGWSNYDDGTCAQNAVPNYSCPQGIGASGSSCYEESQPHCPGAGWTYVGPDYSSTGCVQHETANPDQAPHCPGSGWTYSGGTCSMYEESQPNCPGSGWTFEGTDYSPTGCYQPAYISSYYCPNGGSDSGSICYYAAVPIYYWQDDGSSTVDGQNTQTGAPQLGECYARTFSLAPANTSVSISSTSSSDVPNRVSVNGDVDATFGLDGPSGTPVAACQVNGISTTIAAYYTTPGDANPEPLPGGSETYTTTYGQSPDCNSNKPVDTAVPTFTFSTGIPPLAYGDTVCAYISVYPDGEYMDYTGQITDEDGNPDSNGNGQTAIDPNSAPYTFYNCSPPIGAEPYFKAFGGDVMAGTDSDYISGCYDNSAGIYSWSEAGNGSIGAGTTGAALATGNVSQFASGQNILSMLDPPPLTFANYQPTEYGGDYGEGGNCGAPDYYTLAQSIPGAVSCPSEIDSATLAQQGVTFVNPLSPTISVGQNDHYICYSLNKNVTIASNITYSPPPPNTPANELPVFEVIVKGANIYIDTPFNQSSDTPTPGQPVTELFGNYIAEINNGQGGTIDDTAQGSAAGTVDICSPDASGSSNDYDNTCTQDRLVIDGSFIANQIDLYRSYGTLHDANTVSTYSPSSCSDSGGGDCYDAEEFDFGPINWLTPGNAELTIQSITSLPPVL